MIIAKITRMPCYKIEFLKELSGVFYGYDVQVDHSIPSRTLSFSMVLRFYACT
jgi:hypothetical protein